MSIVPPRKDPPVKLNKSSLSFSGRKTRKTKKKTPIQLCKERIQEKVRALAILIYGDCEAKGVDRICTPPLQADHIESRGSANTYALIENIILLCYGHHFWWKKQYPNRWAALVEEKRGAGTITKLAKMARTDVKTHHLSDWLAAEKILDDQIAAGKESSL